ncbi:MAG: hypothetical protein KGV44_00755 [Flavobacteriaceae bacterium]|nr:hypothetical protein [Flavobacteriaceae bacterium]
MKNKIYILLLLISVFGFSQSNVKTLVEQSEKLLLENNEVQFDKIYHLIWKEYIKEQMPYYQNAVKQTKNNDFENAFKNIDSIIAEDYLIKDILTDKNFEKLHKSKQWKVLKQRIKNIENHYNQKVRNQLIELRDKDQSIRVILLDLRQTKTKDTILWKKVREKMKKVDNESANLIKSIIDEYGWLGKGKIGEQGNQTLFLGIQHIDDLEVQEKYLPILKKAVKKGNAKAWHYAFLTDRILKNQGKKQVYGTQVITSSDPKNSYVIPLQNPDKIDELRKEVGLEPLHEYLEDFGIKWNLENYKKDLKRIEKMYKERFEKYEK